MIKATYLFEGGTVPPEFFSDVYTPAWDARSLMISAAGTRNWGDDFQIVVSADCKEVIDYHLQRWVAYRVENDAS